MFMRSARISPFPACFAFLFAFATALAGCSSDSRRLIADAEPRTASGAEARYPNIFQPKPKEPPPTLSKSEERAVRAQLQAAADTHRDTVESQIAPPQKPDRALAAKPVPLDGPSEFPTVGLR
jgi:parvulin-like peptidyl-prolyl isomerase